MVEHIIGVLAFHNFWFEEVQQICYAVFIFLIKVCHIHKFISHKLKLWQNEEKMKSWIQPRQLKLAILKWPILLAKNFEESVKQTEGHIQRVYSILKYMKLPIILNKCQQPLFKKDATYFLQNFILLPKDSSRDNWIEKIIKREVLGFFWVGRAAEKKKSPNCHKYATFCGQKRKLKKKNKKFFALHWKVA